MVVKMSVRFSGCVLWIKADEFYCDTADDVHFVDLHPAQKPDGRDSLIITGFTSLL
jgi:hypothetical protein